MAPRADVPADEGGEMDEKIFKHEMNRANAMQRVEPGRQDYWIGYQRGLRRAFQDEKTGADKEHRKWIASALRSVDGQRQQRGAGYRDGLKFGK